ncbi:MAG: hypothetical protein ACPGQS_04175 [Bradymonadia bacterium]
MMSHHLSIVVECPTPIGPMPPKVTSNGQSAFVEHILLRIVPLLDDAIARDRPIALALTPAALEAIATYAWSDLLDQLHPKDAGQNLVFEQRIALVRRALKSVDYAVLDLFKHAQSMGVLRVVCRPFEGVDLSNWVSHPGILNFHFASLQQIFETYLGQKSEEISLVDSGYAPHLDASLKDAGFTVVYVESRAIESAQSKLTFGVNRPVLNPANGIALCPVDALTVPEVRETNPRFLNTSGSAVLKDSTSDFTLECYPSKTGLVASYDPGVALDELSQSFASALDALKRRKTRKPFKNAHSLTTIWCSTGESLWWEELWSIESLSQLTHQYKWELTHAVSYLKSFPEQETAWLGVVCRACEQSAAHTWLPRRIVQLYQQFRMVNEKASNESENHIVEGIARLLLFAKMPLGTEFVADQVEFLRSHNSATLLDAAEHLMAQEVAVDDSIKEVLEWGPGVSLVSLSRG